MNHKIPTIRQWRYGWNITALSLWRGLQGWCFSSDDCARSLLEAGVKSTKEKKEISNALIDGRKWVVAHGYPITSDSGLHAVDTWMDVDGQWLTWRELCESFEDDIFGAKKDHWIAIWRWGWIIVFLYSLGQAFPVLTTMQTYHLPVSSLRVKSIWTALFTRITTENAHEQPKSNIGYQSIRKAANSWYPLDQAVPSYFCRLFMDFHWTSPAPINESSAAATET